MGRLNRHGCPATHDDQRWRKFAAAIIHIDVPKSARGWMIANQNGRHMLGRYVGAVKQTRAEDAGGDRPPAELNKKLTTQVLNGRCGMVSSFFYTEALCLIACLYIIQWLRLRDIKTGLRLEYRFCCLSSSPTIQHW